jgi:hypothetical protein
MGKRIPKQSNKLEKRKGIKSVTEEQKERKRLANAASRARKKRDAGKDLSDAEKSSIDSWEVMKMASGRPKKGATPPGVPNTQAEPPKETASAPKADEKAKPEEPKREPVKAPRDISSGIMNRPPPSAPPKFFKSSGKAEDWKTKWRVGTGREATCVEAASLWKSALLKMVAGIEEMEGSPVFDADAIEKVIYPATVLTVDKLLPDGFETTPEATMVFGSTVTIGQHWLLARKKKAEAEKSNTVDRSVRKNLGDTRPEAPAKPVALKSVPKEPESVKADADADEVQLPPAQNRIVREAPTDDGSPVV